LSASCGLRWPDRMSSSKAWTRAMPTLNKVSHSGERIVCERTWSVGTAQSSAGLGSPSWRGARTRVLPPSQDLRAADHLRRTMSDRRPASYRDVDYRDRRDDRRDDRRRSRSPPARRDRSRGELPASLLRARKITSLRKAF
jgi:hypothetical protein